MKLYWGDLHNHCGITYGFGGLVNALSRARAQLDFCAVTGHAMWPDMYERNDETAFIVDFHKKGFQKLYDHWNEVRTAVAAANRDGFVTFQSYEMHSSRYGDHHIVSPDDNLPLIYRDSPAELVSDAGVDAMTIGHHIGYTPGYRGINWDEYDPVSTPLIEVFSKHGCSMRETAPYPYYHDMGPRDSHNTVFEGLRRGFRFGFVGSTDHHAGYPGSYGDGKLAVLAEEKTRESIWDALRARRCYAVTGDRIACSFEVDGNPMGSLLPANSGSRTIRYRVEGGYPLDKVTLYKNMQPIHILNGETLSKEPGHGRYKLRIEMGWGNSVADFEWQGNLRVSGGRVLSVEPCFRGKSILSPTNNPDGFDDIVNGMDNRVLAAEGEHAAWQCFTVRNGSTLHPATCAVIVEIEGEPSTVVAIDVNGIRAEHTLADLCAYGYSRHMKPYHSHAFKVHTANFETSYTAEQEILDVGGLPGDLYHLEVSQLNGCWAFVSPISYR